jgi:hypothetical protein
MEDRRKEPSHDRIELRSDKVRQILGEVPHSLLRWGIAVICMIFVLLMAFILFVKYPYGNGETILEHIFHLNGN